MQSKKVQSRQEVSQHTKFFHFVEPTILADVTEEMKVFKEEIQLFVYLNLKLSMKRLKLLMYRIWTGLLFLYSRYRQGMAISESLRSNIVEEWVSNEITFQ